MQTYWAVLVTTHVQPPVGLEEPQGVFASREEAIQYLDTNEEQWMARAGGWPFSCNIRLNEYPTREQAEDADVSDGFMRGDHVSGHKPLRSEMR